MCAHSYVGFLFSTTKYASGSSLRILKIRNTMAQGLIYSAVLVKDRTTGYTSSEVSIQFRAGAYPPG